MPSNQMPSTVQTSASDTIIGKITVGWRARIKPNLMTGSRRRQPMRVRNSMGGSIPPLATTNSLQIADLRPIVIAWKARHCFGPIRPAAGP